MVGAAQRNFRAAIDSTGNVPRGREAASSSSSAAKYDVVSAAYADESPRDHLPPSSRNSRSEARPPPLPEASASSVAFAQPHRYGPAGPESHRPTSRNGRHYADTSHRFHYSMPSNAFLAPPSVDAPGYVATDAEQFQADIPTNRESDDIRVRFLCAPISDADAVRLLLVFGCICGVLAGCFFGRYWKKENRGIRRLARALCGRTRGRNSGHETRELSAAYYGAGPAGSRTSYLSRGFIGSEGAKRGSTTASYASTQELSTTNRSKESASTDADSLMFGSVEHPAAREWTANGTRSLASFLEDVEKTSSRATPAGKEAERGSTLDHPSNGTDRKIRKVDGYERVIGRSRHAWDFSGVALSSDSSKPASVVSSRSSSRQVDSVVADSDQDSALLFQHEAEDESEDGGGDRKLLFSLVHELGAGGSAAASGFTAPKDGVESNSGHARQGQPQNAESYREPRRVVSSRLRAQEDGTSEKENAISVPSAQETMQAAERAGTSSDPVPNATFSSAGLDSTGAASLGLGGGLSQAQLESLPRKPSTQKNSKASGGPRREHEEGVAMKKSPKSRGYAVSNWLDKMKSSVSQLAASGGAYGPQFLDAEDQRGADLAELRRLYRASVERDQPLPMATRGRR